MKKKPNLLHLLASLTLSLAPTHAGVIFSDNFDGAATSLNGVAPDSRPGTENWVSTGQFKANGSFVGGTGASVGGSATLAFTPAQGLIYTIDTSVTLPLTGSGGYLGFGFADGQSTVTGSGTRFLGPTVTGRAWSLYRANTNNAATGMDSPTVNWTNWTDTNQTSVDMRIVLNTTSGAGNWTATWYYKYPADETYLVARATTTLTTQTITSVGFSVSGDGAIGTINSFSLSDNQAPAPPVLLATNPPDNATGISPDTNLVATFNKAIQLGTTGDFTIKNLTTATDTVISLPGPDADGTLTVDGSLLTIDPTAALGVPGDEIVIEIDAGAIMSTEAAAYGGLLSTDDPNWSFTIDNLPPVPDYLHPITGSDQAPLDGALFIAFNEATVSGSGNIGIYRVADDSLVETINVTSVTVNGNRVAITPTVPLAYGTSYYVLIDTGAFTDVLGNGYGISDETAWTFTTIANEPEMLFGDSFNRADGADLDASAAGKYGSLGALTYTQRLIGPGNVANVELTSGQLLLESNENNGTAGALVYLDHNFTDAAIASAGGFSLTVDLNAFISGGSRFMSVAMGQTSTNLDDQTSASPVGSAGDLTVAYRLTTTSGTPGLFIYNNGISNSGESVTTAPPATPTRMRIDCSVPDFNSGSTVTYSVFFDDSVTPFTSGTFNWSGTGENYISLSSNLIETFTVGERHALFDNLQIRTLGAGGSDFDTWKTTNNATGQTLGDDHDGDGVSNGVEYFIGGPTGDTTGFTPLPGVDNNAGTLSVTWTHDAGFAGTYEVQVSSTLGGWVAAPGGALTFPSANQVKYTFPAGAKNFARLKVTGP